MESPPRRDHATYGHRPKQEAWRLDVARRLDSATLFQFPWFFPKKGAINEEVACLSSDNSAIFQEVIALHRRRGLTRYWYQKYFATARPAKSARARSLWRTRADLPSISPGLILRRLEYQGYYSAPMNTAIIQGYDSTRQGKRKGLYGTSGLIIKVVLHKRRGPTSL